MHCSLSFYLFMVCCFTLEGIGHRTTREEMLILICNHTRGAMPYIIAGLGIALYHYAGPSKNFDLVHVNHLLDYHKHNYFDLMFSSM